MGESKGVKEGWLCMQKENQEIFEMQKKYFQSGSTRAVEFRIRQLKCLKKMVKNHEEELMDAIYQDFGKSKVEQYSTEFGMFYEEVNLFIQKLRKWCKPKKVTTPITHFPCKGRIQHDPYGVVLLIAPFNYPCGLVLEPLVGAIGAGNCIMIKPSEHTVNFVRVLSKLISRYFNKEYIYVCNPSGGKDTVNELLEYHFDYIFFTGSTRVGKIIMERAAKNLIPVTLELGGKSPCIVTENANIKMIAKRIVWGKLVNAGQTCIAPDYVWVQESVKDSFLQEMKKEIELQYGKNPKESADYCRIINKESVRRLQEYIKEGNIYCGGETDEESGYVAPTILVDVNTKMKVMKEEIFGPVLPVMTYRKLDSVIAYLKKQEHPLALYIFTERKQEAEHIINIIPSGGAMVNDVLLHVGTSKFPFGGVGYSGMGTYHGLYSYKTFSHIRTVMVRKTFMEISLRFAPYSEKKLKLFKRILK